MMKNAMRLATSALVALGLIAAGSASAGATTSAPRSQAQAAKSALYPGQQLFARYGHNTLTSVGGAFTLTLDPEILTLTQQIPFGDVWFADDPPHHSNTDRTVLRMQRNGNLVMRTARGAKLWDTGTRGTGNRAVVLNSGNFVVRNAAGRTLWATHTGPRYLGNGATLASGARMNQRWGYFHPHQFTSLVMRRDGDLVFQCNGNTLWSTGTHVPGSSLTLLHSGNLVVRTPRGKIIWSSHTRGTGPRIILDAWGVSLENARLRPIWSAHLRPGTTC